MDNTVYGTAQMDVSRKRATSGRMYDYLLGGVHHFPADRDAMDQLIALIPEVPEIARSSRAFIGRAVRYLAGAGIRQFLDIGSGIPTMGNVHEIALAAAPDARVAYVDIDPVTVAEGLDLLAGNEQVIFVQGDLRKPEAILDHPQIRRQLDFTRPISLSYLSVLHFAEGDEAYYAVARIRDALPPGSYLTITHASPGAIDPDESEAGWEIFRQQTTVSIGQSRTPEEIARFFTGCDLLEPGLVWATRWRPEPGDPTYFANDASRSAVMAGVSRIRRG